jgi:hypothetical protein
LDLSGKENAPFSLLALLAARWPSPDWGSISHVWQQSTRCILGLQGDIWPFDMLFVSPDNSQYLLSTQHQIIMDLQVGVCGGVPVIQVMDLC